MAQLQCALIQEDLQQKNKVEALENQLAEKDQQHKNKLEALENQLAEKDQQHKNKLEALENQLAEKDQQHKTKVEALENQLAEKDQQHKTKVEALENQLAEKDQQHKTKVEALEKELAEKVREMQVKDQQLVDIQKKTDQFLRKEPYSSNHHNQYSLLHELAKEPRLQSPIEESQDPSPLPLLPPLQPRRQRPRSSIPAASQYTFSSRFRPTSLSNSSF